MQFDIFNSNKLLAHTDTMRDIVDGIPTAPITVTIDPSAECNQICVWCSGKGFVNHHADKLSKELLIRLPRELAGLGVKGIVFTGGGEPMCNPHTICGIRECIECKLDVGMITNGMALNSDVIDLLAEPGKFIRISVDASSPSTYAKLHQVDKKNFHVVISKITRLVSEKKRIGSDIQIGLSFLIHPENHTEIESFYKLGEILGVDYVQYKPVVMGKWLGPQMVSKLETILKTCQRDSEVYKTRVIVNYQRLRHESSGYVRLYKECLGQNLIGIVMATGQLCVCCQHRARRKYVFGNLYKQSFEEVWNSKERQFICQNIDVSKCPTCRYELYNQALWLMKNPPIQSNFL